MVLAKPGTSAGTVSWTIHCARKSGRGSIAEWVETEAEAGLLHSEGLDYLKVWHCSRPEVDPDWLK